MQAGLPRVFALDRRRVRERGVARFGAMRMVDEYIAVYERLIEGSSIDANGARWTSGVRA